MLNIRKEILCLRLSSIINLVNESSVIEIYLKIFPVFFAYAETNSVFIKNFIKLIEEFNEHHLFHPYKRYLINGIRIYISYVFNYKLSKVIYEQLLCENCIDIDKYIKVFLYFSRSFFFFFFIINHLLTLNLNLFLYLQI